MKISFLSVIAVLFISSCSAPKYTASFSNYKHTDEYSNNTISPTAAVASELLPEQQVLASVNLTPVEIKQELYTSAKATTIQIDKKERKEAMKKLRSDIKTYVKEQKSLARENSYQDFEWDNDLKLAVIFGAAGLVGVLLGGISVVFPIIGGIALIIAVVFFVQWVLRQ